MLDDLMIDMFLDASLVSFLQRSIWLLYKCKIMKCTSKDTKWKRSISKATFCDYSLIIPKNYSQFATSTNNEVKKFSNGKSDPMENNRYSLAHFMSFLNCCQASGLRDSQWFLAIQNK